MIPRVGLHAGGRELHRVTSLVVLTQFWASGSTMVLLVLAARTMPPAEFGRYALHFACVTLVVALSDGGLGTMVVREIARTGSLRPLRWSLKRRMLWVAGVAVPVVLIGTGGTTGVAVVAVALTAWMNSWYSAIVGALFALDMVRRVILLQLMNGFVFIGFGALAYWSEAGLEEFLAVVGGSYFILTLGCSDILIRLLGRSGIGPKLSDQLPFILAGAAYGIGSSIDSFLLGRRSSVWVGEYAASQRLALGVVPISHTLSAILLPRFTMKPVQIRTAILVGTFLTLLSTGAFLGTLLLPVAGAMFGSQLVIGAVLPLLLAAYAVDILLVSLSMNLLARGQERSLAAVAWVQTFVVAVCAWMLLENGPTAVASALVIGRVVGFSLMLGLGIRMEDRK